MSARLGLERSRTVGSCAWATAACSHPSGEQRDGRRGDGEDEQRRNRAPGRSSLEPGGMRPEPGEIKCSVLSSAPPPSWHTAPAGEMPAWTGARVLIMLGFPPAFKARRRSLPSYACCSRSDRACSSASIASITRLRLSRRPCRRASGPASSGRSATTGRTCPSASRSGSAAPPSAVSLLQKSSISCLRLAADEERDRLVELELRAGVERHELLALELELART